MKTIKDVFDCFKKGLAKIYDDQELEAITLYTISEVTSYSRATIKAFPEKEISPGQTTSLQNILKQLETGEPIQYILGYTEFYGLNFLVNPSVLIPRPETEELVNWILSSVNDTRLAVLDIGTGSGCIAISLKKNLPETLVSAMDISNTALETARENATLNKVEVDFIRADVLNLTSEIKIPKFEIIVSNPPYVTLTDKEQMHINVTNFEPHTALFVPENDPLIFYRAIIDYAVINLADKGLLFFEINESYGQEVVNLLAGKEFKDIELKKDMGGKFRMVKAVFN